MMRHTLCATVLFTVLAALPARAQDPRAAGCHLGVVASLEMRTTPEGRVTVPVQVDKHEYQLMVDTGGYISTLSARAIKQEGYQSHASAGTLLGMGTTRLTSYVTAGDVAIGSAHGRNLDFYVETSPNPFEDGQLAPQTLAAYDADFDFIHDKLNLISQDHCPGQVVYWTGAPATVIPITMEGVTHIRLPVVIDGKEVMAVLDTGAHTSVIPLKAAKAQLGFDEKAADAKGRTTSVNGMSGTVYRYPFKSLKLGGVTVSDPDVEIVSDQVWNSDELLLGMSVLRQFHLYIAYGEKKIYLTPATAK